MSNTNTTQNLSKLTVEELLTIYNIPRNIYLNKTNLIELIQKKIKNPNFQINAAKYRPNWVSTYENTGPNPSYSNNNLALNNNNYNRISYKADYYSQVDRSYAPRPIPPRNVAEYPYLFCESISNGELKYYDIRKTRTKLENIEIKSVNNKEKLSPKSNLYESFYLFIQNNSKLRNGYGVILERGNNYKYILYRDNNGDYSIILKRDENRNNNVYYRL